MSIYGEAMKDDASENIVPKQSKTWFTSDQHFFHHNIITYCNRPFGSVDHMNMELIRRYNAKVMPEDTVFHLGDFSMSFKCVEEIVKQLNGTKILIYGNHDACSPLFKHRGKVPERDYRSAGFYEVYQELMVEISLKGKQTMVKLHHLPYEPTVDDKADRRYLDKRPKDEGQLLLHGHIHNARFVDAPRRMINVGVDTNPEFSPWSLEDIDKIVTDYNIQI